MAWDPVTLEVLRNALQSISEEMGVALTRTALSPNIKDRRDCSTAIYTVEGELVAQAEHIPLHLGLMPEVVRAVLRHYPLNQLSEGDAIIINDPYISGSHLPDICLLSPVFCQGEPVALVANLAHHVDVGGMSPGSMSTSAREIFQEGIRIPPVKIIDRGAFNHDLIRVLSNNVRTAKEFQGDIQAQIAANGTGGKRLKELAVKTGASKLAGYMEEIINYSERRMRTAIAKLPEGEYVFQDWLEGDGLSKDLLSIKVRIIIKGDTVLVDFSGTSPQTAGPVNATRAVTLACVYFAIKSSTDPDIPSNEGMTRPIKVITPPGTLVNPLFPAPVAHANINTAQRITDALLGALALAGPDRVTAAGTGSMSNFTIGGLDPERGVYFSYVETYGGGQGAKSDQDGMDGVHVNMTNTRNTPVEVIEMSYPLLVEKYGLIPDSGGPGRFRGGLGLVREIHVLAGSPTFSLSTERALLYPWGLDGGGNGRRSRCIKRTGNMEAALPGKVTGIIPASSTLVLETAGGGGFGDALARDPEMVRQDVLDGLVSPEAAADTYGVVLQPDSNLAVDHRETIKLRDKIKRVQ